MLTPKHKQRKFKMELDLFRRLKEMLMKIAEKHIFWQIIRISIILIFLLPLGLQWRNPGRLSSMWQVLLCSVIFSIGWTLHSLKVVWDGNINIYRLLLLGGLCFELFLLILTLLYRNFLPDPFFPNNAMMIVQLSTSAQ